MTNTWTTYNPAALLSAPNLDRYFVGADQILKKMVEGAAFVANTAMSSFPPYNLKKVDDNKYVIEMAVAGFSKQDIEITLEDNKLLIKGVTSVSTNEEPEKSEYLYKGIAARDFTRAFTVADSVEINNAELVNGMLKIWLEHMIAQPNVKKIAITDKTEPKVK